MGLTLAVPNKQDEMIFWEFKDKKGNVVRETHLESEPMTLDGLMMRFTCHGLKQVKVGDKWYKIQNLWRSKTIPNVYY